MSRGKRFDSDKPKVFVYMKGSKKSDPKTYFSVMKKDDDENYKEISQDDFMKGYIVNFAVGTHENDEGKVIPDFTITLDDHTELMIIKFNFTVASRGLLNSLLGTENLGELELSVFKGRSDYPVLFCKNNGQKMTWSITKEEMDKMVFPIKNGDGEVIQNDYVKLDRYFFRRAKDELVPRINNAINASLPPDERAQGECPPPEHDPPVETAKQKVLDQQKHRDQEDPQPENDLPF